MTTYRTWNSIDGRDALTVTVGGDGAGTVEQEAQAALDRTISEIVKAGLTRSQVVRGRLYALDRTSRQEASDIRRATLVGPLRCGTSSFIDTERLPKGCRVIMEVTAIKPRDPTAQKVVREYEPVIAPPMFATLDGLVFLSGNTDESATFEAQLGAIRGKIDASLKAAGTDISKAVAVSAFMSKTIDIHAGRKAIAAALSGATCPIVLTTVEGYSAPTKLIEIEVTARL